MEILIKIDVPDDFSLDPYSQSMLVENEIKRGRWVWVKPTPIIPEVPKGPAKPSEDHPLIPSTVAPVTGKLTTDPNDPDLGHGINTEKVEQNKVYLVLSEEERKKGFIRPVRRTYVHDICGSATVMGQALAETYARNPKFYGATYCCRCTMHRPVAEFKWEDGEVVGS